MLGPICLAGVLAAPALARLLTTGTADPVVAADQRELATFLLRLFIPQVLLYAVGAVTTAVLHAKRHFTVTAVAPIGNTVMMVAALVAFRVLHGPGDGRLRPQPGARSWPSARPARWGWRPSSGSRPWRCGGPGSGSGSACPGRPPVPRSSGLGRALRLSGWAGLQHAGTGVLLAAALLVGMGVSGGVVAYQVAFACFLVPYAVLALPLDHRRAAGAGRRGRAG